MPPIPVSRLANVLGAFLMSLLFALVAVRPAVADDCLRCHDGSVRIDESGPPVDVGAFRASVHADGGCVGCHADARGDRHGKMKPVKCGSCHAGVGHDFAEGVHGRALSRGIPSVPTCPRCHGSHDIPKVASPDSRIAPSRVATVCRSCHKDGSKAARRVSTRVAMGELFFSTNVHAKAPNGSPSCPDCHGSHKILPGDQPLSSTNRPNVLLLCGRCHDAVLARYRRSAHAKGVAAGAPDAPVCTDCHAEHIRSGDGDSSSRTVVCLACHKGRGISSRYAFPKRRIGAPAESFHGIVVEGGVTTARRCASCHGGHEILPPSDPESPVFARNLRTSCGRCHPGSVPYPPIAQVWGGAVRGGAKDVAGGRFHSAAESAGTTLASRAFRTIFVALLVVLFALHIGVDLYSRWVKKPDRRANQR